MLPPRSIIRYIGSDELTRSLSSLQQEESKRSRPAKGSLSRKRRIWLELDRRRGRVVFADVLRVLYLCGPCSLIGVARWQRMRSVAFARRSLDKCPRCKYSLEGLDDHEFVRTCPECGTTSFERLGLGIAVLKDRRSSLTDAEIVPLGGP